MDPHRSSVSFPFLALASTAWHEGAWRGGGHPFNGLPAVRGKDPLTPFPPSAVYLRKGVSAMAAQGPNRRALTKALRALGLKEEHEAIMQAAKTLASAVDDNPASDNLWREYRFALKALKEAAADGDHGEDPLDDVRAAVPDAS